MAGIWGEGPRGGIFGARVDPRLLRELEWRAEEKRRMAQGLESAGSPARIEGAFEAAESMQEPLRALYEAKHRRAQGLPPETSFWEDVASLGSRAVGGAQKMWQMAPAAAGALWEDPLGSVNRVGQAGQAATDAIVRGAVQPAVRFNDPRFDQVENAADLTGSVMLGSAAIPAEANALRMGIKAYHGSPHSFEKFDASKIGTGEGAQAYGHGLYFAEREGVAGEYRKKLASGADTPQFSENVPQNVRDAVMEMHKHFGSSKNYSDYSPGEILDAFKRGDWSNANRDVNKAIKRGIESGDISMKPAGKMYEVDIAAEPEQFLDFDAPISAQPQHAQDLLQSLHKYTVEQDGKTWRVLHPGGWVPNAAKNFYRSEDAARQAAEQLNQSRTVQDLVPRNPEQVAPFREAGIPGIRYLDQGSRKLGSVLAADGKPTGYPNIDAELTGRFKGDSAALKADYANTKSPGIKQAIKEIDARGGIKSTPGQGTSNYVVFDDKLISILRKYGLPISAAGLAALTQLHPEEAKAAQKKDRK